MLKYLSVAAERLCCALTPKASDLLSLMPFSQNLMDLQFQGPQNIMHREGMSNLWCGSHKNEVSIKIAADGKFKV